MRNIKYFLVLILLGFFLASCEKKDTSVIDPVLNFPVILSASVNPMTVDSSNISIIASANVTSIDPLKQVTAKVTDPVNADMGIFNLHDDGVAPDQTAGDNIYTGSIIFQMSCRVVGSFKTEFQAESVPGLFSGIIIQNFNVVNSNNLIPALSDLILADSIQRPAVGLNGTQVQIKAEDPNGECDIKEVFFKSIRPDGQPGNQGNPIFMYDDGQLLSHCDSTANDKKFSVCIVIDNQAQTGYYKFTFTAKDRSDSTSNSITDSIYVYQ